MSNSLSYNHNSAQTPYLPQNIYPYGMSGKQIVITSNETWAEQLHKMLPNKRFQVILFQVEDCNNEWAIDCLNRTINNSRGHVSILTVSSNLKPQAPQFINLLTISADRISRIKVEYGIDWKRKRVNSLIKELDSNLTPLTKKILDSLPNDPKRSLEALDMWYPTINKLELESKNKFRKRIAKDKCRLQMMDSPHNVLFC